MVFGVLNLENRAKATKTFSMHPTTKIQLPTTDYNLIKKYISSITKKHINIDKTKKYSIIKYVSLFLGEKIC